MQAIKLKNPLSNSREKPYKEMFSDVSKMLAEGVHDGVAPGMVLLVAKDGNVIFLQSAGKRTNVAGRDQDETTTLNVDTVYDVASLTNIVVTTTLLMKLVESGKVRLEDKVSRYIQGFGVMGKSTITIAHLLSHTSGLIPWAPYFEELVKDNAGARLGILTSRGAKDYIVNNILRSQLKFEAGSKQAYSDSGFIILGHLIEILTGLTLEKAAIKFLFQPLGLKSTSFIDLALIKRRGIHPVTDLIAPTEQCDWRGRMLCGEVHDDNAWVMGGVAGHSGLFSCAADLHIFAREMISAARGQSNFLQKETVDTFMSFPMVQGVQAESWRYGWSSPSKENNMLDSGLSEDAVGITSPTGCSLWLEPKSGLEVILLSNAIHPNRSNKKILSFRPEIHSAILKALKES